MRLWVLTDMTKSSFIEQTLCWLWPLIVTFSFPSSFVTDISASLSTALGHLPFLSCRLLQGRLSCTFPVWKMSDIGLLSAFSDSSEIAVSWLHQEVHRSDFAKATLVVWRNQADLTVGCKFSQFTQFTIYFCFIDFVISNGLCISLTFFNDNNNPLMV